MSYWLAGPRQKSKLNFISTILDQIKIDKKLPFE
jgi:hypothetical protein